MVRIGFLGPKGTFSQEAVKEYLKIKCLHRESSRNYENYKGYEEYGGIKQFLECDYTTIRDILFAVDSIPAIIGVIKEGSNSILTPSEENFIAISSNLFAVMGLVSLFFALKGVMSMFRYLKTGVSVILLFIGAKMISSAFGGISNFFAQHSWFSLIVIITILIASILMSIIITEKSRSREAAKYRS